jgi:hypothetical protein
MPRNGDRRLSQSAGDGGNSVYMGLRRVIHVRGLVLGLGLGLLLAEVVPAIGDADLGSYGETINGHADFESALVRELTLADGTRVRAFRDLTVYPATIDGDGGKPRPVHVVSGTFVPAPRLNPASGRIESREGRRCFVAAIPYRSRAAGGAEFRSVMEFLGTMRVRGVGFRYAWWFDPRWAKTFWVAGGALLLGVGWPGVVSLVRRTGLVAAEAPASAVAIAEPDPSPVHVPTGPSLDAVMSSLESSIADEAALGAAGPPGVASESKSPEPSQRTLTGGPLEPGAPETALEAKTYGAREDDYYPTERRKHGTSAS